MINNHACVYVSLTLPAPLLACSFPHAHVLVWCVSFVNSITVLRRIVPSKHGKPQMVIVGHDLFDGKKYTSDGLGSRKFYVPVVETTTYLVLEYNHRNGEMSLLHPDTGAVRKNVSVPESEVGAELMRLIKKRAESEDEDVTATSMGDGKQVLVTVVEAVGRAAVSQVSTCER